MRRFTNTLIAAFWVFNFSLWYLSQSKPELAAQLEASGEKLYVCREWRDGVLVKSDACTGPMPTQIPGQENRSTPRHDSPRQAGRARR